MWTDRHKEANNRYSLRDRALTGGDVAMQIWLSWRRMAVFWQRPPYHYLSVTEFILPHVPHIPHMKLHVHE